MMLRRLMEHLKVQNWGAVVLDLLIVIVGVFIGFQVTAWNEDRQLKAEEHATLLRLQSESEQVVAYWRMEVQLQQQHNENRRILLEVLDKGVMAPGQQAAVDDALLRLGHYPHFNPPRSVISELIAAGGLARISDIEVRNAFASYAAELDFALGQLTQFRTNLPGLYGAYEEHVFSVYAPERKSMRSYEYDIAELAADRQFVSVMVDSVRDQLQFLNIREFVLSSAITMCETVSRAVSMTCDAPQVTEEDMKARDGVNQEFLQ